MSHHLEIKGSLGDWAANFNGDFSGTVEIIAPTGEHYGIPFFVLEAIVAEEVRRERIAELEDMPPSKVLR